VNANDGYLRIGELSRRVGAGVESLRAWERRYGLLSPSRTPGGFRLYGDADVRRVQLMQQHLAAGLSAAEAARLALADVAPAPSAGRADATPVDEISAGLRHALDTFDEAAAHAAFDRALASLTLETLLRSVVLP
jgi:MerR family transcriptional regulator, light-induced transcriptional regulator